VTLPPAHGHQVDSIEFVMHYADGTWGKNQVISLTTRRNL